MLWYAVSFNQPLNKWDTSQVQDMKAMFSGARRFNQPLSDWNTSRVADMGGMFREATRFDQPLNNWNTSQVANMMDMFYLAHKFNQPLDNWNTSNVRIMNRMFFHAISFNQPLKKWDTSQFQGMNGMFSGARRFDQPLSDWNTSRVADMEEMFRETTRFNQPLHRWDTSHVANMHNVFKDAPLMLARYPDGKLPPSRWQQVRDRGIRDRQHRRWKWQVRCDVNRHVSHEELRRWATEYGISLHDPDTQRPKTKRALCAELAQLYDAQRDAQMDTHRVVHPTCHNPTTNRQKCQPGLVVDTFGDLSEMEIVEKKGTSCRRLMFMHLKQQIKPIAVFTVSLSTFFILSSSEGRKCDLFFTTMEAIFTIFPNISTKISGTQLWENLERQICVKTG